MLVSVTHIKKGNKEILEIGVPQEILELADEIRILNQNTGDQEVVLVEADDSDAVSPSINELVEQCHSNAVKKGFWDDVQEIQQLSKTLDKTTTDLLALNSVATRLALIQSEVSEALEAVRNDDEDNFFEELADICIRVFDLAGHFKEQLDLEDEILVKMEKNKNRPYKHGKKF